MPEIGEVARVVHYIRKHLVGKTLTKVVANVDDIVYGKVGTSAAEFEKHMSGKKVVDAGQQGKYFWMIMSSPPHPVMHLGMSGWFKIKSEHTYYYRKKDNEEQEEWPPKYAKFLLEAKGDSGVEEAAFVDARRLARIRLVDCVGKEIRKQSPLKENGPDPVIDKDIVTVQWLTEKCNKKKVPIKAMLLDQAVISGIGNWVGDEIMYHAKMHPEQYANTLQDSQIKQLHESLHYVCGLSCELLADTDRFPEDWLFKHRWGKGKKNDTKTLPNGNKIEFLTVGGRTSAVVPAVQKKTGPVAKDVGEDETNNAEQESEEEKPKKAKKPAKPASSKKAKAGEGDVKTEVEEEDKKEDKRAMPAKKTAGKKRKADEDSIAQKETTKKKKTTDISAKPIKEVNGTALKTSSKRAKKVQEVKDEATESEEEAPKKASVRTKKAKEVKDDSDEVSTPVKLATRGKKTAASKETKTLAEDEDSGKRRSGRLKK